MEKRDFNHLKQICTSPEEYARLVNSLLAEYGEEIIAFHHAIGNPVYYTDAAYDGLIIKEMPDGTRYIIKPLPDRKEEIIRKL